MTTQQTIATLAEELWQFQLARQPYLQLRVGATVEQLPSGALAEAEESATFGRDLARRAALLDASAASEDDRLTLAFVADQARWLGESEALWWTAFPVTPYSLFGISLVLQQVLPSAGAEPQRHAALVNDLATTVRTLDDQVAELQQRGWLVPAPAFDGVVATLTGLRAAVAQQLGEQGAEVVAAFEAVLARVTAAATGTARRPTSGCASTPVARRRTSAGCASTSPSTATPARSTSRASSRSASLDEAKAKLRADLGFDDEEAFVAHLDEAGRLHAATPADVERVYGGHIARIQRLIPDWFSRIPEARHDVERLDPALEPGMSYGYYEPPTSENAVGRYRYNGSGLDTRSQLNAAAIIFHELVPGHHFHLAAQGENTALPMVRRHAIALGAYTEGWAEYAAALAGEMGLYDDPIDRYGHLVHQSFLACRLVVDPGMNLLGWSLEEARDFMRAHCLEDDAQIATETLRYSTGLPGQGLAYRVGHGFITDQRERARAALGDAFDIRDFHEQVLGPGALPLHVLAGHIDRWIAATARS